MNLLQLFSSIVKYNLPFTNKIVCIQEIKQQFSDGGGVWQKFAQTLSGQGDLIGDELAKELQTMCFDCPAHDDVYSARIIRDAFGDKYDTVSMKMIGSGTISQVYKAYDTSSGKFVAIKVMHPNIKKEIRGALDMYNSAKDSYLFPKQLKVITQMFFDGLREQLDMKREFKNGKLFKELLQPLKKSEANYKFIIPEMIACSKKCLVMSYEESKLCVDFSGYDHHTLYHITECIILVLYTMTIKGILHMDLHMGNVGVRDDKIVIYDFGQMKDIRKLNQEIRNGFVINTINNDLTQYISCYIDDTEIVQRIISVSGEGSMFERTERCFRFVCMNNIPFDANRIAVMVTGAKPNVLYAKQDELVKLDSQYSRAHLHRNGYRSYIQTMFPYDEFKELALLFD